MARDTFCSYCGAQYADTSSYPRLCVTCGTRVWANPAPVAVVLLPVIDGERTGLLVVRRAIPPVGRLALIGGFVDVDETWQQCAAREMWEETGVKVEPASLQPLFYDSVPNHVLLFSLAPAIRAAELPPFVPNDEASECGVIFGPGDADGLAFPLHVEAARRYFGADGPLDYVPR